jgi:excisionase family DNA binding protein
VTAERWFKTLEVAEIFGVQTSTVRGWIKQGKIPEARHPNGQWIIPESAIRRLANEKASE